MSGSGHYNVHQGKRVLVVMKDGQHFVARFRQHEDRFVHFSDHERIRTKKIRTLSIYREAT